MAKYDDRTPFESTPESSRKTNRISEFGQTEHIIPEPGQEQYVDVPVEPYDAGVDAVPQNIHAQPEMAPQAYTQPASRPIGRPDDIDPPSQLDPAYQQQMAALALEAAHIANATHRVSQQDAPVTQPLTSHDHYAENGGRAYPEEFSAQLSTHTAQAAFPEQRVEPMFDQQNQQTQQPATPSLEQIYGNLEQHPPAFQEDVGCQGGPAHAHPDTAAHNVQGEQIFAPRQTGYEPVGQSYTAGGEGLPQQYQDRTGAPVQLAPGLEQDPQAMQQNPAMQHPEEYDYHDDQLIPAPHKGGKIKIAVAMVLAIGTAILNSTLLHFKKMSGVRAVLRTRTPIRPLTMFRASRYLHQGRQVMSLSDKVIQLAARGCHNNIRTGPGLLYNWLRDWSRIRKRCSKIQRCSIQKSMTITTINSFQLRIKAVKSR